jgi:hypothetical protein
VEGQGVIKKVYLAGAITGLPDPAIYDWRDKAVRLLTRAPGVAALDPTRRGVTPGVSRTDYKQVVEADLADLAACDAVICNCTHPSWGAGMEIYAAKCMAKRVVVFKEGDGPLSAFVLYFTDSVEQTLGGCVRWLFEKWGLEPIA